MIRSIRTVAFCLALLLFAAGLFAQQAGHESPRAAMMSFLEAINRIERGQGDLDAAWSAALGAMDTSQVDTDAAARQAARDLNEVLDKLGQIRETDLPDAEQVRRDQVTRFTFFPQSGKFEWVYDKLGQFDRWPEGRIVLERGDTGWRFNAQTVATIGALAASMEPLPPLYTDAVAAGEADHLVGVLGRTFRDTQLWQWGSLAGCIFLGLLVGRLAGYTLRRAGDRWTELQWRIRGTVMHNLASPLSLALLAAGLMVGLSFISIDSDLRNAFVNPVVEFLFLVAAGWFGYNLIEVIEVALRKITDKTESKLDDMVVPLVRKTLRIFLIIVFALVAAENIFGMDVTGFLAGLGIAGLAVSLAAQDSVKNLFGSLTIFFDKPFLVGDFITYEGETGSVEEIGFRSTRIRLLSGHLVTVPNMRFIDSKVENISARPHIRRQMDVTITYDTPAEKIDEAVAILRDVLHDPQVVEQGMFDMEKDPPRIAFNEFNAASLNLRAYYWYKIPRGSDRGFFTFLEHAQLVNTLLFRRYAEAGIDFAFPTQTLYLAGDDKRRLTVDVQHGD